MGKLLPNMNNFFLQIIVVSFRMFCGLYLRKNTKYICQSKKRLSINCHRKLDLVLVGGKVFQVLGEQEATCWLFHLQQKLLFFTTQHNFRFRQSL